MFGRGEGLSIGGVCTSGRGNEIRGVNPELEDVDSLSG